MENTKQIFNGQLDYDEAKVSRIIKNRIGQDLRNLDLQDRDEEIEQSELKIILKNHEEFDQNWIEGKKFSEMNQLENEQLTIMIKGNSNTTQNSNSKNQFNSVILENVAHQFHDKNQTQVVSDIQQDQASFEDYSNTKHNYQGSYIHRLIQQFPPNKMIEAQRIQLLDSLEDFSPISRKEDSKVDLTLNLFDISAIPLQKEEPHFNLIKLSPSFEKQGQIFSQKQQFNKNDQKNEKLRQRFETYSNQMIENIQKTTIQNQKQQLQKKSTPKSSQNSKQQDQIQINTNEHSSVESSPFNSQKNAQAKSQDKQVNSNNQNQQINNLQKYSGRNQKRYNSYTNHNSQTIYQDRKIELNQILSVQSIYDIKDNTQKLQSNIKSTGFQKLSLPSQSQTPTSPTSIKHLLLSPSSQANLTPSINRKQLIQSASIPQKYASKIEINSQLQTEFLKDTQRRNSEVINIQLNKELNISPYHHLRTKSNTLKVSSDFLIQEMESEIQHGNMKKQQIDTNLLIYSSNNIYQNKKEKQIFQQEEYIEKLEDYAKQKEERYDYDEEEEEEEKVEINLYKQQPIKLFESQDLSSKININLIKNKESSRSQCHSKPQVLDQKNIIILKEEKKKNNFTNNNSLKNIIVEQQGQKQGETIDDQVNSEQQNQRLNENQDSHRDCSLFNKNEDQFQQEQQNNKKIENNSNISNQFDLGINLQILLQDSKHSSIHQMINNQNNYETVIKRKNQDKYENKKQIMSAQFIDFEDEQKKVQIQNTMSKSTHNNQSNWLKKDEKEKINIEPQTCHSPKSESLFNIQKQNYSEKQSPSKQKNIICLYKKSNSMKENSNLKQSPIQQSNQPSYYITKEVSGIKREEQRSLSPFKNQTCPQKQTSQNDQKIQATTKSIISQINHSSHSLYLSKQQDITSTKENPSTQPSSSSKLPSPKLSFFNNIEESASLHTQNKNQNEYAQQYQQKQAGKLLSKNESFKQSKSLNTQNSPRQNLESSPKKSKTDCIINQKEMQKDKENSKNKASTKPQNIKQQDQINNNIEKKLDNNLMMNNYSKNKIKMSSSTCFENNYKRLSVIKSELQHSQNNFNNQDKQNNQCSITGSKEEQNKQKSKIQIKTEHLFEEKKGISLSSSIYLSENQTPNGYYKPNYSSSSTTNSLWKKSLIQSEFSHAICSLEENKETDSSQNEMDFFRKRKISTELKSERQHFQVDNPHQQMQIIKGDSLLLIIKFIRKTDHQVETNQLRQQNKQKNTNQIDKDQMLNNLLDPQKQTASKFKYHHNNSNNYSQIMNNFNTQKNYQQLKESMLKYNQFVQENKVSQQRMVQSVLSHKERDELNLKIKQAEEEIQKINKMKNIFSEERVQQLLQNKYIKTSK